MILPPTVSLYDFCTNVDLFEKLDPLAESWFGWNTIFKVLSGMKLTREEGKFFHKVSGELRYRPGKMPQDLCVIVGRKGGKSNTISRISLYHTLRFDPVFHKVAPGEEPSCLIICPNFRTSLIDIKFTKGMLEENESMSELLIHSKQTEQIAEITISNGCYIRLIPVTAVSGRGPSTYCLMLDEAAFFKKKGQFCDSKIFDDARPGMARFGNASRYFILTSPGRKDGLVWDYYQKFFGIENDEVLVINGSSKDFNPTLSDEFLEKELRRGGESFFKREYLGEFVDAINAAFSERAINTCINEWIKNTSAPLAEHFGVVDPAGLSPQSVNGDEFTAGIFHNVTRNGRPVVRIDRILAWNANIDAKPRTTNPQVAIAKSIEEFKQFKVRKIMMDKYKTEAYARDYTDKGFEIIESLPKNDLYLALDPVLNSSMIEIPVDKTTISQLKSLERVGGRGSKDRIDHMLGEHDDRANIIALAAFFGRSMMRRDVSLSDVKFGGERTVVDEVFGEQVMHGWEFEGM
ncbi:hypothetical protein L0152_07295 [bacterium]|nr:hypothetical protein [bacterium]